VVCEREQRVSEHHIRSNPAGGLRQHLYPPNTVWNLTTSTGNRTSGQLTLESGGNIIFWRRFPNYGCEQLVDDIAAGYSWANNAVQAGVGNIYLNGAAARPEAGPFKLSQGLNNNLPTINLTAGTA